MVGTGEIFCEKVIKQMVKCYCVKCRTSVEAKNAKHVTSHTKHGIRHKMAGSCPKCGTNVSTFIKNPGLVE